MRSFQTLSADTLRGDYLFMNNGYNPANSLSWTINGLKAGTTYKLFNYAGVNSTTWDMSVDTTGTGGLSTQSLTGGAGTAFYSSITASNLGTISGTIQVAPGVEAQWAGFQIAEVSAVPEPGSLALAGMGALGSIVGAWRRRRKAAA